MRMKRFVGTLAFGAAVLGAIAPSPAALAAGDAPPAIVGMLGRHQISNGCVQQTE